MPRILLIEDDTALRRALRIALQKSGHDVAEAGNGREGIAAFTAQTPDLVVTDLIMPEVEGIETIRQLRQLSPGVPIIAMSGGGRSTPAAYLQAAKFLGATQVLEKPFEIDILRAAVTGLLSPKNPA